MTNLKKPSSTQRGLPRSNKVPTTSSNEGRDPALYLDRLTRSRKEGWQEYVEASRPESPDRLTVRQIHALSPEALAGYNQRRAYWHANFGMIQTDEVRNVTRQISLFVESNCQRYGLKPALALSGLPGLGKTEVVNSYAKAFHRDRIHRYGEVTESGSERLPVCRVGMTGITGVKEFVRAVLNFYAHPARGTTGIFFDQVQDLIMECGTGTTTPYRGSRVRPGHGDLHRSGWQGVHPVQPGPRRKGANMAGDADPAGPVSPSDDAAENDAVENVENENAENEVVADAATEAEALDIDAFESEQADDGRAEDDAGAEVVGASAGAKRPTSSLRLALVAGLIGVVALGGLSGWLGYRAYQSHQTQSDRELFLQVARQGALNLTTIDFEHADSDIQRILDSATGQFHDDFAQRAKPFVEVVKQAQSKSVGTIAEAGLESVSGDEAQAIVAVTVNTSNLGAPEQQPRSWRMRLTVQKVGQDVKVSNVGFVP